MALIDEHKAVQGIAKQVLANLGSTIGPLDTEQSIAARATRMMADLGATETWYYDCPAFVLLGSRSCLSISGREYQPSDESVGMANLITVDLSPSRNNVWGDCARSFCLEDGRCVEQPTIDEFRDGIAAEQTLHAAMLSFVRPDTTFQALFEFANAMITDLGFENLDFLGNVGHSIESARADRRYIEAGNTTRLSDARLFTFEPHIRKRGGAWGHKHENIYCFGPDGRATEI